MNQPQYERRAQPSSFHHWFQVKMMKWARDTSEVQYINSSSSLLERFFHCLIVMSSNLSAAFLMSFYLNICIFLTAGGTFCCSRKYVDDLLETAAVAANKASDSIIMPVVIYWFSRFNFSEGKHLLSKEDKYMSYRKDEMLTPEQHFNLCRLNFQLPKDILSITTAVYSLMSYSMVFLQNYGFVSHGRKVH